MVVPEFLRFIIFFITIQVQGIKRRVLLVPNFQWSECTSSIPKLQQKGDVNAEAAMLRPTRTAMASKRLSSAKPRSDSGATCAAACER